ncbi:MAG: acyltransferase [Actinobacteria bacterium]|nr:acyltransferase [Actinomycetota bacterium]
MPLFFLVGGALHARERRDGAALVRHRFARLVPPVLPLLGLAAGAAALAWLVGRTDLVHGVVLMITPLWFLAVYLVLVVLTPLARRVHRRCGLWAIALGASAVAVVDRLTLTGHLSGIAPMIGEYVLTWAVVHQLGFHLDSLRHAPRTLQRATCLGGFGLLAAAAAWCGYPASMVGTHTDPISNMSPPNLMVVFLAVAQMGSLVVLEPTLRRWSDRHRRLLGTAGAWSMTVYVWHMLALAAFWGLLVVLSGPVDATIDGSWWAQRPLWLVGPTLFALPLFALSGPRRTPTDQAR